MTRVRRINVSQVEGDGANNTSPSEIRPYGEMAVYVGDNNKLELLMFDGVRTHVKSKVLNKGTFYGGDADSSDGLSRDTIKLVPDEELRRNGSDQYLVVDPTIGEPGHIHIRAGGTINQSTADLFLGGELNNVRVSDVSNGVYLTSFAGFDNVTYTWNFNTNGDLVFPGATSRIGEDEPGLVVYSNNGFAIQANVGGDTVHNWIFGLDGNLTTASGLTIGGTPIGGSSILQYDAPVQLVGESANAFVVLGWAETTTAPGNIAVISFNTIGGPGNVAISTGSNGGTQYDWRFDNTGNLTLPSNNASINYANGVSILDGIGVATVNGNVTVQTPAFTTVTGYSEGGLPAGPGTPTFFTSTGNSPGIDQVAPGWTVTGNNLVGTTTVTAVSEYSPGLWEITTDTEEIDPFWYQDNYTFTSNVVGVHTWSFATSGELGIAGNLVSNDVGAINFNANSSGDGNGYSTMQLIPDLTRISTDQYLIIDPTAPGHIHIRAGGLQDFSSADLIFGGEASHVKVSAGSNPPVYIQSDNKQWAFGTDGVFVTPGDISLNGNLIVTTGIVGIDASPAPYLTGFGSITTTDLTAGNITVTGTGGNVVTKATGSWTVATGTNNYNFTVAPGGTYVLWVLGNIPNGIIKWNATATVSNTNVPVAGAQYAWVYDGGGTPIDFTSIPNQFIGTSNTIVRSSGVGVANSHVFTFGINNSSGSPQTVSYGWIKIS